MSDPLTPDAAALLADWARRVEENAAQVERLREAPDGQDFYGPVAQAFRADPRRSDEPVLDLLRALVRRDETWLDIGAGGGRYALPIALLAREVIAVDPSPGMLNVLREGMAEERIENVRIVESRWPEGGPLTSTADVALISHVGYDIAEIGPFLDAMEAAARRLCVAVLLERPPAAAFEPFWEAAHGEPRARLPALPEFLHLLLARGRLFELQLSERGSMTFDSTEAMLGMVRRQTWTVPGSEKDRRVEAAVKARMQERGGRYATDGRASRVGIVSWAPR